MKIVGIILVVVLIIALAVGLSAFEAWVIMSLWNAVVCAIFPSLPELSFWLAAGLLLLCNILFGGCKAVHSKS
jgi:hypothetical protein